MRTEGNNQFALALLSVFGACRDSMLWVQKNAKKGLQELWASCEDYGWQIYFLNELKTHMKGPEKKFAEMDRSMLLDMYDEMIRALYGVSYTAKTAVEGNYLVTLANMRAVITAYDMKELTLAEFKKVWEYSVSVSPAVGSAGYLKNHEQILNSLHRMLENIGDDIADHDCYNDLLDVAIGAYESAYYQYVLMAKKKKLAKETYEQMRTCNQLRLAYGDLELPAGLVKEVKQVLKDKCGEITIPEYY